MKSKKSETNTRLPADTHEHDVANLVTLVILDLVEILSTSVEQLPKGASDSGSNPESLVIWRRRNAMKAGIRHGEQGMPMQFEGVQYITPADELMQKEEATEEGETINFSEIQAIPADALPILLRLILPSTNPLLPQFWRTAQVRLCVVASAIGVDPIAGHSLTSLAAALGCTRATLSYAAVGLRDFANLGHRGGRCDAARVAYRNATKAAWTRRKQTSEP